MSGIFFANFVGTLLEYAQIYFRHRRSNVSTHKICAHQSLSRSIPEGTMRHSDKMAKWSAFVLLLFALSATLQAQLNEGSIDGAVTDVSGAAVAGASVKVANLQTGAVVETKTDNIGYYRVPHLQIGAYQIRVEGQGFKASVLENVPVNVNTTTRADAKLQVGGARETVEVSGAAALIQTEEARLSNTITQQEINNLPLN